MRCVSAERLKSASIFCTAWRIQDRSLMVLLLDQCPRILDRKSFVRSFFGRSEELLRWALLDDLALVHEDHAVGDRLREAHLVRDARSSSCPASASSIMTSSTSLIISGSSAEVGSSNSMIFGLMHKRARDGDALLLAAGELPGILVRPAPRCAPARASCMAVSSASAFGMRRTHIGASVRFSRTVRCGKQVELLEHHADLRADLLDLPDVVGELDAVDDDRGPPGAPRAG